MKKRRSTIIILLCILITAFLYPNVCKKREVKTDTRKIQRDTTIKNEGFSNEQTQFAQSKTITVPDVLEMRKQQEQAAKQLIEQIYGRGSVSMRQRVIVCSTGYPPNHWITR